VLPTIAETVSGQPTTSETPVRPFVHTKIGDANVGATDTLTITVGGVGGTLTDGTGFSSLTTVSAGVYRLSGIAAAITSGTRSAPLHADRGRARHDFHNDLHVKRSEQRQRRAGR
jgi:hypothetical protein